MDLEKGPNRAINRINNNNNNKLIIDINTTYLVIIVDREPRKR